MKSEIIWNGMLPNVHVYPRYVDFIIDKGHDPGVGRLVEHLLGGDHAGEISQQHGADEYPDGLPAGENQAGDQRDEQTGHKQLVKH